MLFHVSLYLLLMCEGSEITSECQSYGGRSLGRGEKGLLRIQLRNQYY